MVVVDDLALANLTYLDEGLDLAAASELLRAHRLRHLERVALNTGGNHEGEAVLLVALVVLLDHDDLTVSLSRPCGTERAVLRKTYLLTSVPTLENNAVMCEP